MIPDSFFEIGTTHEVCEDFARSGFSPKGEAFAVVNDGCSNGGGPRIDTDHGARLIGLAAESNIMTAEPYAFIQETSQTAKAHLLLLPPESLCATLLLIRTVSKRRVIQGVVSGDGVIGCRKKNGTWIIHVIDFPPGGKMANRRLSAPYYLQYHMYGVDNEWAENYGANFTVTTYIGHLMDEALNYPDGTYFTKNQREELFLQHMSSDVREGIWNLDAPFELFEFGMDDVDLVFITSDGPEQFYFPTSPKVNEPIHVLDVLRVLLDIRGFNPGFLRVQRNWNFKQNRPGTFKRKNWSGSDDVSVGAIYCGE